MPSALTRRSAAAEYADPLPRWAPPTHALRAWVRRRSSAYFAAQPGGSGRRWQKVHPEASSILNTLGKTVKYRGE